MNLYERIKEVTDARGIPMYQLEQSCGLSNGAVSKWKTFLPNTKTLVSVADYLHLSVDELLGRADQYNYYVDLETAAYAQALKDNEDLKLLFRASRNMTPEQIRSVAEMISKLSR